MNERLLTTPPAITPGLEVRRDGASRLGVALGEEVEVDVTVTMKDIWIPEVDVTEDVGDDIEEDV